MNFGTSNAFKTGIGATGTTGTGFPGTGTTGGFTGSTGMGGLGRGTTIGTTGTGAFGGATGTGAFGGTTGTTGTTAGFGGTTGTMPAFGGTTGTNPGFGGTTGFGGMTTGTTPGFGGTTGTTPGFGGTTGTTPGFGTTTTGMTGIGTSTGFGGTTTGTTSFLQTKPNVFSGTTGIGGTSTNPNLGITAFNKPGFTTTTMGGITSPSSNIPVSSLFGPQANITGGFTGQPTQMPTLHTGPYTLSLRSDNYSKYQTLDKFPEEYKSEVKAIETKRLQNINYLKKTKEIVKNCNDGLNKYSQDVNQIQTLSEILKKKMDTYRESFNLLEASYKNLEAHYLNNLRIMRNQFNDEVISPPPFLVSFIDELERKLINYRVELNELSTYLNFDSLAQNVKNFNIPNVFLDTISNMVKTLQVICNQINMLDNEVKNYFRDYAEKVKRIVPGISEEQLSRRIFK